MVPWKRDTFDGRRRPSGEEIQLYLAEIGRYPLLSGDDERRLGARIARARRRARPGELAEAERELVRANLSGPSFDASARIRQQCGSPDFEISEVSVVQVAGEPKIRFAFRPTAPAAK